MGDLIMAISYRQAWDKAGYYLMACSGFPLKSKYKLTKTSQSYFDAIHQHKVVFTLMVDHPSMISEKMAEPVVGYQQAIENKKNEELEKPFKLMRELIDILELRAKERALTISKNEDAEIMDLS